MMDNFFDNSIYIQKVMRDCKLTETQVKNINEKYASYANPASLFFIPFVLNIDPHPYKPIRINPKLWRIYVPDKEKTVKMLRAMITEQLGSSPFLDGSFPRYEEVILHFNYYIKTPQFFSREKRYLCEAKILRPAYRRFDNDNMEKIVFDTVKEFLIYDDSQVVTNVTSKYYSVNPRIEVLICYNTSSIIIPEHLEAIKYRKERWSKNETGKDSTADDTDQEE